jgi:hypothetical protein
MVIAGPQQLIITLVCLGAIMAMFVSVPIAGFTESGDLIDLIALIGPKAPDSRYDTYQSQL